jgi:small-conductance mechanosensitive channel
MRSPLKHTLGDTVNVHDHLASESQHRITLLRSRLRNCSTEKKTRFEASSENGKRDARHNEIVEKVYQFNDKLSRTVESEQANLEHLSERLERLHHMLKSHRDHRQTLEANKKQDLSDLGLSLSREVACPERDKERDGRP